MLLSRHENLTDDRRKNLERLLQANGRLNIAYLLREQFEQLWDYADAADARSFFDAWREQLCDQDLAPYEKFAAMIERNWDGVVAYSRAARVVEEMMNGHTPDVWISDRYSAQQKHGAAHQTCLPHLARDTAFALEHGADDLPLRFKLGFGKAFDLARDIASFKASTIASKRRELEKQLATLLAAATGCDLARQLQAKIGRAQEQLLVFCDYPGEVEATNNGSERKLRPCVIQRKVTNGYRAMWAAQAEADARTTVDTARLTGANHFQTILDTLV